MGCNASQRVLLCYFYIGLMIPVLCVSAHVEINASPEFIEEGRTAYLTVNCTYSAARSHAAAELVSVVLYKTTNNTQGRFQKIASVNVTNNEKHGRITKSFTNLKVKSWIDDEGVSYLELGRTSPTTKDAGEYTCVATLLSVHGEPSKHKKSTIIAIPWYMRELDNLQAEIQKLQQENRRLKDVTKGKPQVIKKITTTHTTNFDISEYPKETRKQSRQKRKRRTLDLYERQKYSYKYKPSLA